MWRQLQRTQNRSDRRMMIRLLLCFFFVFAHPLFGQERAPIKVETFTYKKVGELEIKLDVHRPDDKTILPLAVWIHGGALINGGRQGIGPARQLLDHGFAVATIDYRLAPETKLPEIIADLEDAFRWMRENGRERFHADTSKIAVLGGSAGGYMALTAGFRVDPPPTLIVAYWGYGDLVTEWMTEPSPHPGHRSRGPISTEEMRKIESGLPIANPADRKADGGLYYATTRQLGVWAEKVSGFDEKNIEKFYPFMAVKNVSPNYPPTLMIHGTEDTDVPHEQSEMMAQEFEKHGVPYEFISVKGGEHGLRDAKKEDITAAHARMVPFVLKWMK